MQSITKDSICLRKDLDYSPHIDDTEKKGYHVKREEERRLLLDFLARRTEGALLSGRRGVGKTSAIFSIIYDVKEMLHDRKILAILVNAPSFEIYDQRTESDNKQGVDLVKFKRIVLQNLIRRLYTEAVEKQSDVKFLQQQHKVDFSTKISNLFRRAVAKEVKEETNLQELESEKAKIEKEILIKLSGTEKLIIGTAASLISAAFIALYPAWIEPWNAAWIEPWH